MLLCSKFLEVSHMKGVMTEQKLLGIVKDLLFERFGSEIDPRYREGFCAGFHDLACPCLGDSVPCAEGFLAGQNIRRTFLTFHGGTTDADVVAMLRLALDPDAGERIPAAVYKSARWTLHGFCTGHRPRLFPGVSLSPLPLTAL
jgi:hypothetical protein